MISIGKHAYFNVSMISFCRIPNVLIFPCLRLLLQEVVHHDAAHAETLHWACITSSGCSKDWRKNSLNHVIPVANENYRSLIVPLESLLDQSFHIFEVLSCSITFIMMNKFWSLWHDYDYVWRRCKYKNIFSELWVVDWQFSQEESAYRAHWRPCGSRREPHVCCLPCCTPAAPATFHKLPCFYKHFSWGSLFTRPATIRAK